MNAFEKNSIHLNGAGYEFGIARVRRDGEGEFIMPLWINWKKSDADHLVAILGSEPKLGENHEERVPRIDIVHLVSAKGVPVPK